MSLSLIIMVMVGFLSNKDEIYAALFYPSRWSPSRPLFLPAWICIGLVALGILLAVWDNQDRARVEDALEQDRNRVANAHELLLKQSDALRTEFAQSETMRKTAESRAFKNGIDLKAANQELLSKQQELNLRTSNIEGIVRSLPYRNYVPGFDEAARSCHSAMLLVLRTPKSLRRYEESLEYVRYVLYAAANLVKNYEGHPTGVYYTANCMVFRPTQKLTAAEEQDLRAHMLITEGISLPDLRGVLDLRVDLTATTEDTVKIVPDSGIQRLVLPVPRRYSEEERLLAFPGAPTAFCRGSMDGCSSVHDVVTRCERDGVLSLAETSVLRTYFEERVPHIRSFVSIPLYSAKELRHPMGVVNINSSVTGLLREPARHEAILPNLRALLWNLPEMITELDTIPRNRRRSAPRRAKRA